MVCPHEAESAATVSSPTIMSSCSVAILIGAALLLCTQARTLPESPRTAECIRS